MVVGALGLEFRVRVLELVSPRPLGLKGGPWQLIRTSPEGDITLIARMAERAPPPLRVWHTLKYQAYDPAGADAAVELVRRSTANSTNEYYGLLGMGEHIYLPMFDNPRRTEPYSDEIAFNFMKIARDIAQLGKGGVGGGGLLDVLGRLGQARTAGLGQSSQNFTPARLRHERT